MPFISSVRGSYGVQSRRRGQTGRLGSGSTGGTITTAGGYRIHTFTATGTSTFTADDSGTIEYLIVAGGGGGGVWVGSGGGAGGYLTGSTSVVAGNNTVVVGVGGDGWRDEGGSGGGPWYIGQRGGNSSISAITATGGGAGGSYGGSTPGAVGSFSSGGSGGGAMENNGPEFGPGPTYSGGAGIVGQGYPGGNYKTGGQPGDSEYAGAGVVVLEKLDSTLTELHKEQTEVVMVFLVL